MMDIAPKVTYFFDLNKFFDSKFPFISRKILINKNYKKEDDHNTYEKMNPQRCLAKFK